MFAQSRWQQQQGITSIGRLVGLRRVQLRSAASSLRKPTRTRSTGNNRRSEGNDRIVNDYLVVPLCRDSRTLHGKIAGQRERPRGSSTSFVRSESQVSRRRDAVD